jgi:hypothetical protein
MEELKDIKGIVEVTEYSFETLIALLFLLLVLLGMSLYLFINRRKRRKKPTPKEMALQRLKNINYHHTKEVAYCFSSDAFLWIDKQNQETFEQIEKALVPYKYKKEIPPLEESLKVRIKRFIKGLK